MGFEKPKEYSEEEIKKIEETRKRVIKLGRTDVGGEHSIHELAKDEDSFRAMLKKKSVKSEEIREIADVYSDKALKTIEAEKEKMIDDLTGLRNKNALDIEIPQILSIIRGERQSLDQPEKRKIKNCSVLMIDIDHFKKINDDQGHLAGDKILKNLASVIKKNFRRKIDVPYRFGGEEFGVFLPNVSIEKAKEMAEKVRKAVNEESEATISVGVSSTDQIHGWEEARQKLDMDSVKDQLIGNADAALYVSKDKGRNRVTAYNSSVEKKYK